MNAIVGREVAMTARRAVVVRCGLMLLAAAQGTVGGWALLAPRAFFDGFPAAGHAWVALLPPYNEHLVRDVGALSLALTVVLGAAALTVELRLVRVALAAFLVYAAPHTAFHGVHLEGFGVVDGTLQMIGFALQLGIAVGLLTLTTGPSMRRRRRP